MKKSKPNFQEPTVAPVRSNLSVHLPQRKPPAVKRAFGTVLPTTNMTAASTSNNGKNPHATSLKPSSATRKKNPSGGRTNSKPFAAEKQKTKKDGGKLVAEYGFSTRPSISKVTTKTTINKSATSCEKEEEEIRKPATEDDDGISGRRSYPLKSEEEEETEGLSTPAMRKKRAVGRESKTPYHSAQNCSKCRVDRLESASYWIEQIKLAESVGKHSVSAAFFRLALECHAQPSRSLRIELRSYAERHRLPSGTWTDVRRLYGLLAEKPDRR